jgi:predicted AlkP superfamily phosphohydrolase/phosphomutase
MESIDGHRVLVIGLDGGTFDILRPLIAAGELPNLGRMMQQGAWGELRSTVPPHSAPAWSSFATGANPGRHGVYHFRPIDRRFYEGNFSRVVNARSVALPTMWARASKAGKRVGVINVPLTYPPEPVNGFIISGMLTPRSAPVFTFPPELSASLQDYVIDAGGGAEGDILEQAVLQRPEGVRWLTRALNHQLEVRTRTAVRLFGEHQPDLAVIVFTETDRLHHFFWPCLDERQDPPPHLQPYCAWAREFYAHLDKAVGRVSAAMGEEVVHILMSDHGFGPYPTRQFYANAWLRDLEFLNTRATSARATPSRWLSRLGFSQATLQRLLSRLLPRHQVRRLRTAWGRRMRLPIDWEHTQAYFMPLFDFVGGIVINLPPDSASYEEMRDDLISRLRELVDPDAGLHVVEQVHRREELYEGPYVNRAPDLVLALDPFYVGDRSLLTRSHFGTMAAASRQWTGTHRSEGILAMTGPPIRSGMCVNSPQIEDLAPTIIHLMGLPIPQEMDGRVLEEVLQPNYLANHPIRRSEGEGEAKSSPEEDEGWASPDEEEQVAERLQALGYME